MIRPALEVLRDLELAHVDDDVGGWIEEFIDQHPLTSEFVPTFERFLTSTNLWTRRYALVALIDAGHFYDYVAEVVQLHYQSREMDDSPVGEYCTLRLLRSMAKCGNVAAQRALDIFETDPYVHGIEDAMTGGSSK